MGLDEGRLEQQILWRIATQRKLRKHRQLRTLLMRMTGTLFDAPPVAGKITDGGVDLANADLHGGSRPRTTSAHLHGQLEFDVLSDAVDLLHRRRAQLAQTRHHRLHADLRRRCA